MKAILNANANSGYHGDDGKAWSNNGDVRTAKGVDCGPKFRRGDVIGCGYVVKNSEVSCYHSQ